MELHYKNLSLEDIIYIDDDGVQKTEKWRDIPDYENQYKVSDFGRVKSFVHSRFNGKIKKQQLDNNGYLNTCLKSKRKRLHQLVAMAFLNHKPNGYNMVVNHIDFNRENNNLINLEIVTFRENGNKKHLKSSSKYVGVYRNKLNKYVSQITINGKNVVLGSFNTEDEASEYYQNALNSIKDRTEIIIKLRITSSIYKGVYFCKRTEKWKAFFKLNKETKKKHIGYFNAEKEALEARDRYIENLKLTVK